jgi:23S rRNA (cytosine1962-C5)-methyltransferase
MMKTKNILPQCDYALIDSGGGRKLERFGDFILIRPCAQAVWRPQQSATVWEKAHARFERSSPGQRWYNRETLPESWVVSIVEIRFNLTATNFGHVGVFPEQAGQWQWVMQCCRQIIQSEKRQMSILNLFAYSGGATLAAAKGGASVTHVDASSGMVARARENAVINCIPSQSIRWIVDDVNKFLQRELRRGNHYDGIILDPPTFGRGNKGEVYKIDDQLIETLTCCRMLLSTQPVFMLLSSHTPGYTPRVMHNVMQQTMEDLPGDIDSNEMLLDQPHPLLPLPSGAYARWSARSR